MEPLSEEAVTLRLMGPSGSRSVATLAAERCVDERLGWCRLSLALTLTQASGSFRYSRTLQ